MTALLRRKIPAIIPFIILVVVAPAVAFSQVSSSWRLDVQHSLNTANRACAMVSDANGDLYVLATTWVPDSTRDMLLVKVDQQGKELWRRVVDAGFNLDDLPAGLALDRFGNVWICGTARTMENDADIQVLRFDPEGALTLQDRFGLIEGKFDAPTRIMCDPAGAAVVSGYVTSADSGIDQVVIRYRPDGSRHWYRTFATMSMDIANDLLVDDSCHIYTAGTADAAPHTADVLVCKYDSSGSLEWSRRFDGSRSDNDAGLHIVADDSSRYFVSGYMNRSGDRSDIPILLFDSKGQVVRDRIFYGGTTDGQAERMEFQGDTLRILSNYTDYGMQRTGSHLLEYSGDGNQLYFLESLSGEIYYWWLFGQGRRLILGATVSSEEGTLRPAFLIPGTDSDVEYRWEDTEVNGLAYIRQVLVANNAVYYLGDDAGEATGTLIIMRYETAPEFHRDVQVKKDPIGKKQVPTRK